MAIITLTTDFGEQEGFVGAVRGVILSIAPHAYLVDITHNVPPHDVRLAAFTLYQVAPYYPKDTIHLCVVDPGVGSKRRPLAVATSHGTFIAPDNGVLSYVYTIVETRETVLLANPRYRLVQTSHTFHGRDLFAPAAAHLANGVPITAFGPRAENLISFPLPTPRHLPAKHKLESHVMHIDRFGNLILDLKLSHLPLNTAPTFEVGGILINGLVKTFSDVEEGQPLAYVGSCNDHIELAFRNGSLAEGLGIHIGDRVIVNTDPN